MATNLGEQTRVYFSFEQLGVPFDPVSVTVLVKTPSGGNSTIGPGSPVQNPAVGEYYYDYLTTELGNTVVMGVGADASGVPIYIPEVIEVVNAAPVMPRVMTSQELELSIGAAKVDQLFDDNSDGVRDPTLVAQMLRRAEDYALSYMLNAWAEDAAVLVMQGDAILRMHMAFVAAEFASERRAEFLADDGKGRYDMQFQRAEKYFDQISKGRASSTAEATAGANGQVGGSLSPRKPPGLAQFVFAPDSRNPTGHGGF